jgi:methionine synthase II (cobalamin-independent)
MSAIPWRPAAATSIGSFPGTAALETARVVAGELPDFIHVAELPARGPGADMIGRTGGLLSQVSTALGLETTPDGWRFAGSIGRDMRRAVSFLGEDLDALEQSVVGYGGPVKCQVVGPWTLAAAIELPGGERALRDSTAVWDIAQALSEAIRGHVADLSRRLPGVCAVVVQLDEPSLPAVLAGRIGTASGLSSYRAVDVQDAERVLGHVLEAATAMGAFPGVHCCAPDIPIDLIRTSGAAFVSMDITGIERSSRHDEGLGQAWDEGLGILAGAIPALGDATDTRDLGEARASAPLRAILHRLGLEDDEWLAQVAVTPTCGLAGASPQWAREALAACRTAGRISRDDEAERLENGDER